MLKRLVILGATILILGGAAGLMILKAWFPWRSLPVNQKSTGDATSRQSGMSIPGKAASPGLSAVPIYAMPSAAPTPATARTSPACFKPLELPPFAFSPDGRGILVRTSSGVQRFELETGAMTAFIKSPQNLISADLSQDGAKLAWAFQDGTIQLVDFPTGDVLADLSGDPDSVNKLHFSHIGDSLISASHDGLVRIWDLHGKLLTSIDTGAEVVGFGISEDGTKMATIPFDGPVMLWDLGEYSKTMSLGGSGGYDTSSAYFSPDGQYIAADLATGIYLWRSSDGSLRWHHVVNSMAVNFSPDGKYLVYSDIDDNNKVTLASPDSGQFIRVIDQMQSPVWDLFFSPDSSLLAITDATEIHIWRVAENSMIAVGKSTCP